MTKETSRRRPSSRAPFIFVVVVVFYYPLPSRARGVFAVQLSPSISLLRVHPRPATRRDVPHHRAEGRSVRAMISGWS
eukprot:26399-Pelagococcus_subviridis.AAC.2